MQPQISLHSFAEKKEVLLVVAVKVMDTDGRIVMVCGCA